MYLTLHSQLRQIYGIFEARLKALERHGNNSMTPYITLARTTADQLTQLLAPHAETAAAQPTSQIQSFNPSNIDDPAEYPEPWLQTICGAWDRWLVTLTDDPNKDKNSADCLILAKQVRTDLTHYIIHFTHGEE